MPPRGALITVLLRVSEAADCVDAVATSSKNENVELQSMGLPKADVTPHLTSLMECCANPSKPAAGPLLDRGSGGSDVSAAKGNGWLVLR